MENKDLHYYISHYEDFWLLKYRGVCYDEYKPNDDKNKTNNSKKK